MTTPIKVIAIDGTAASGKGTLARKLAQHLDYALLDTGLLYRRVALDLIDAGIDPEGHAAEAAAAAQSLNPATLDDPRLRGAEAGRGASVVAAMPAVRQALFDFQRAFPARSGKAGAILDGRDIGTVIFPDADLKFFIDADQTTRAQRRHKELLERGEAIDFATVLSDMQIRDARDSGRPDAPMKAAGDAIRIDTTALGPDAVLETALAALTPLYRTPPDGA